MQKKNSSQFYASKVQTGLNLNFSTNHKCSRQNYDKQTFSTTFLQFLEQQDILFIAKDIFGGKLKKLFQSFFPLAAPCLTFATLKSI